MGLPMAQIVAVEQPLQLLAGEAEHGLLAVQRPAETLGLQLLVPQTEAIALLRSAHFTAVRRRLVKT